MSEIPEELTRDYPADEMTRDPIFLFQRCHYVVLDDDPDPERYEYVDGDFWRKRVECACGWTGEAEELVDLEDGEEELACPKCRKHDLKPDPVPNEEMAEVRNYNGLPAILPVWDTELVFFTREEGEAYGKAKNYRYREGWRVYCVPAQGKLIELLKLATAKRPVEGHEYLPFNKKT